MNCSLGEGPFWEDDTNTLRFLDVEKCKVFRVDMNVGASSLKTIKDFDISIGYFNPFPHLPTSHVDSI
jgi:sugar lactone lactonase YvrE